MTRHLPILAFAALAAPVPALATAPAPAGAQDLGGVIDLGQHAAVQAHAATMTNAARDRRSRVSGNAETARLCRKLRTLGHPAPRLRERYYRARAMCRENGY